MHCPMEVEFWDPVVDPVFPEDYISHNVLTGAYHVDQMLPESKRNAL